MATILSFLSGRQITDDNGAVVPGAKLIHYQANTTDDLTVYQNQAGTTPHAQPVVCDAGGFVPLIFIDSTSDWKVVITDADDAELQTYDNLPAAPASTSGGGFFPPLFAWNQVVGSASPVALTGGDAGKAYEADTTTGNIEFDLPSAAAVGDGKGFLFKKTAAANSMIIDQNGSETIDGSATALTITAENEVVAIFSNGAEWYRVIQYNAGLFALGLGTDGQHVITSSGALAWATPAKIDVQTFDSSGSWTKPSVGANSLVLVRAWGGGGGGGQQDARRSGGGGGGGYTEAWLSVADLASSETVTIGAGGTGLAASTNGSGGNGGNSTFGSHVTAYGGGGGGQEGSGNGGGGGGVLGAGQNGGSGGDGGGPDGGDGSTNPGGDSSFGGGGGGLYNATADGGNSAFGGAGGGGGINTSGVGGDGGNSLYGGGGGGGGGSSSGGTSVYGGNGGGGGLTSTPAVDGTQPGGGGGGGEDGGSGAGGAGRIEVYTFSIN